MKKRREVLESILLRLFIQYNADKQVFQTLKEETKGKMYSGRVAGLFDLNMQIGLTSDSELYLITQGMFKAVGDKHPEINPQDWFKESEIERANEKHAEEEIDDFIIFKNLTKKPSNVEDEWIAYISYGQIKRAWEQGFIKYDQDTQRTGITLELFGKTYVLPTIFKSNVEKIKRAMIGRRYHTNMLTFNITNTPTHKKFYNKEERSLQVWGYGATAVIDGGHRTLAIIKAVDEKPELENEYIAVMIKNLLVSSAQEFIFQEAQGVKQSAKTLSMVNSEDIVNRFCRNVNNERRDNSLFNKVGLEVKEYDTCLIPIDKFIEAMKDNFKEIFAREDAEEIESLRRYIIDFFNVVIENNKEVYIGNPNELKARYISYTSNFTVGLIKLASELYGDENWDIKLLEILNNLDWDVKNEVWKKHKIISPKFTPVNKKHIYNFFQDLVR